jgi:hypothetical protein
VSRAAVLAALWLCAACATPSASPPRVLGVLFTRGDALYFASESASLPVGAELRWHGAEPAPEGTTFYVGVPVDRGTGAAEAPMVDFDGRMARLHEVDVSGTPVASPLLGVAALGDVPVGAVRECTSGEGVHWFVDQPGAAQRWHAYAWLGYDTEPTCSAADFD